MRQWICLIVAIAIGPVFLLTGYHIPGLMYGAAAAAVIGVWVIVVPWLTIAAGDFKLLVWQISILSITCAIIGDNLRLNAIHRKELVGAAYVFWACGTLLSSPLPIYFLLRPLETRRRFIVGGIIVIVALTLGLGIKKITR